jgi:hypothetical protein
VAAEREGAPDGGTTLAAEGVLARPDWDAGVLQALYKAAFSEPGAEIVGVLVGHRSHTRVPPRIAAMIPASKARFPERAHLNHEAWAYIHATMARYYAGLEIVGWWVSRPGPDTVLERAELVAAGESFARPNQFGFVFDSEHRRVAFYGWQHGAYVRVQEEPIPRRLTAPPEADQKVLRPAIRAVVLGVAMGVAGWLAAGRPGLSLASMRIN